MPKWVDLPDFVFWLSHHPVRSDIERAAEGTQSNQIRARVPAVALQAVNSTNHIDPGLITQERAKLMSGAIEGVRRETNNKSHDFTGADDGSCAVFFRNGVQDLH